VKNKNVRSKVRGSKFNGDSGFSTWQRRMRDMLIQQGLHKVLDVDAKKPDTMKAEDWADLDERAASTIRLHLSDDVVNNIIDEETVRYIWTRLESQYISKTLTNKLYLKKQLYTLDMRECTNSLSHLNMFNVLITQLANLGVKIEEEDKAILLLNSLPSSYDNLVTTILYDKTTIELKDVISALLLNEKMREKPENQGHALITEGRGRSYQRSSRNYDRGVHRLVRYDI